MALAYALDSRPGLVELASGVDALYLSGRAELPEPLVDRLTELKAEAVEAGAVPLGFGADEVKVEGHGFGKYRFCLSHRHGRIGLTPSDRLPALRVQPRSEFLHAVGPAEALGFFEGLCEMLVAGPVRWGLSRLDLFCDVQGWELAGDLRHRFVCRADRLDTHEEGRAFTGFEFGRRSTKTVCARIYDKTLQVEGKGLDWWYEIWGEAFDPSRPVYRVEFEIGRQGLVEFGIKTPSEGLDGAGAVWANVTDEWLSYRVPTADGTKARWPVAPEWRTVQGASLRGAAIGLDRVRAGETKGDLRRITPPLIGYLARAGAALDLTNLSSTLAGVRGLVEVDEGRRGVPFDVRIAEKRRP